MNIKNQIICNLKKIYNYAKYWKAWGEHKVSYGIENEDKVFFVIRKRASDCGLLAFYITNLGFISYAITKGYIPIIDMQNCMIDSLMEEHEVGKTNIWEKYFEQPKGFGLSDISKSKNIILSKDWNLFGNDIAFPMYNDDLFTNKNGNRDYWCSIVNEFYILNKEMKEYIERKHRELFSNNERVLGVLYRGTDFTSNTPKGHYKSPTFDMMAEKIKEVMKQKKVDKIYLATEDVKFRRYLDSMFPKMVVSVQNNYVDYKEHSCINSNIPKGITKYEAGKIYLASIYILSKSNYLIACRCSAASVCACLNSKYEYEYFWDLGRY